MKTKNHIFLILFSIFTLQSVLAFDVIDTEKVHLEKQEPASTIIESLLNGESYSIEITSVGCFNGSRQTIVVSKEADILTASFLEVSKILSEEDMEAFRTFELQLQALKIGGCSTVDTYVIRFGNDTFRTSDGTCSWNGGKKLLNAIS
ncbi:MAG: hypothetical protein AB8B59_17770 [Maribacter sp.]